MQDFEVQTLNLSPLHQLQIEVGCIFDDVLRVQLGFQVDFLRLVLRDLHRLFRSIVFALAAFKIRLSVKHNLAIKAAIEANRLLLHFLVYNLLVIGFPLGNLLASNSIFDENDFENVLPLLICGDAAGIRHKFFQVFVNQVVQQN